MSIFSTILSKIFPPSHPAVTAAASGAPAAASGAPAAASGTPAVPAAAPGAPASNPPGAPTASSAPPVDVNAILEGIASKNPEKLNWQSSIVDLLKLLDLDSSHEARLTLAKELNFTGDTSDSASMNIWLHRAVMQKLEENGGTVPDTLKH